MYGIYAPFDEWRREEKGGLREEIDGRKEGRKEYCEAEKLEALPECNPRTDLLSNINVT